MSNALQRMGAVLGFVMVLASTTFAQDVFNLSDAVIECGAPKDVASWPVTTAITTVDVARNGVLATFDKRDGPRRWPDVRPVGWDGDIQYTLWIGMQVAGQWHVGGIIEFWYTRGLQGDDAGGDVTRDSQIARNWTYDCGAMARQPSTGEAVAFFVTAGDQRKKDTFAVHERSNVVVIPFPAAAPATFQFSGVVAPPVVTPPPPVVTPPPVAVPTAQIAVPVFDTAALERQIAELKADVDAGRAENQAFYEHVGIQWKQILAFAGKYIAPVIGGILGGMQISK